MKGKVYLAATALLSVFIVGNVYAMDHPEKNDAEEVLSNPVSLIQAVTTAEKQLGGKAARAEYETSGGKPVYEIEVVTPEKVVDVKIDAASGNLLSTRDDSVDHGGGETHENKGNCGCEEEDD